jgi:hypothetical protein
MPLVTSGPKREDQPDTTRSVIGAPQRLAVAQPVARSQRPIGEVHELDPAISNLGNAEEQIYTY